MTTIKERLQQIYPPEYFIDTAILLADRGWTIERVILPIPRVRGTEGLVVTDDFGTEHQWDSLRDLKLFLIKNLNKDD